MRPKKESSRTFSVLNFTQNAPCCVQGLCHGCIENSRGKRCNRDENRFKGEKVKFWCRSSGGSNDVLEFVLKTTRIQDAFANFDTIVTPIEPTKPQRLISQSRYD
eukprot:UN17073